MNEFMVAEYIAGGMVVTGIDLLTACLTLAYITRLVFDGLFGVEEQGGCYYVVKRSLQGQHIARRAR